ncbi:hypothetical protein Pla52o_07080 [Novipirellula galeiformis]|uniref:DUF456 domain-containing protein n=1 Tax=Novipirellula galeiformis TaxID=2528004 RepID=A0A5C6CPE5_9BACT|nr:DUF456 domain-containing protein [Novipirellula galeiformis]TWU26853.1 hypothetical protein Pla52o_07080 [Novipirellula galeiformis]
MLAFPSHVLILAFAFDTERWLGWLGPAGSIIAAVLLVVVCIAAWGLNLVTLPGNWISVAAMALYAWLGPSEGRLAIGTASLGVAFLFALLGEIVEFAAGALGAQKAGASRRSTLYAVAGSMAGALIGAFVGIPVPILGPILAAILFGGVGATAGAIYGEWTDGRSWRESWTVGHAAFWGRTFGTLGKFIFGLAVVLTALIGVLV